MQNFYSWFCRVKNFPQKNKVNLCNLHCIMDQVDLKSEVTIYLCGQLFTRPNQENKFCIMSLVPFFGAHQWKPVVRPSSNEEDQRNNSLSSLYSKSSFTTIDKIVNRNRLKITKSVRYRVPQVVFRFSMSLLIEGRAIMCLKSCLPALAHRIAKL